MKLRRELLGPLLEVIPLDLAVIDDQDRLIWWNRHLERMFKIPMDALGVDVRQCHPEKSVPVIDRMLNEMKSGRRDAFRMWFNRRGRGMVVIDYIALRGEDGTYLGCAEIDQDVEQYRRLSGEDRSLR